MANPSTNVASYIPDELILALASGLKTPTEVAAQFGLDAERLDRLLADPNLLMEVGKKRQVLELDGHPDAALLRMMYMDMAQKTYIAMHGPDVTPTLMMQFMKTIGPFTRLEPQRELATATEATFTIVIDMGDETQKLTFDGEVSRVDEPAEQPLADDEIPPLPAHLSGVMAVESAL